jgi:hypothetical protein
MNPFGIANALIKTIEALEQLDQPFKASGTYDAL